MKNQKRFPPFPSVKASWFMGCRNLGNYLFRQRSVLACKEIHQTA